MRLDQSDVTEAREIRGSWQDKQWAPDSHAGLSTWLLANKLALKEGLSIFSCQCALEHMVLDRVHRTLPVVPGRE
jgi:hypothetical protein